MQQLPAGAYVASASVEVEGVGDATVVCWTRAAFYGANTGGIAKTRVGGVAGAAQVATLAMTTTVSIPTPDSIVVVCWKEDSSGSDPSAMRRHLVVVKVGSATRSIG
jgi:hypothetical protein